MLWLSTPPSARWRRPDRRWRGADGRLMDAVLLHIGGNGHSVDGFKHVFQDRRADMMLPRELLDGEPAVRVPDHLVVDLPDRLFQLGVIRIRRVRGGCVLGAGDPPQLLDGVVQHLGQLRVRGPVVHLFSVPAADDQALPFKSRRWWETAGCSYLQERRC